MYLLKQLFVLSLLLLMTSCSSNMKHWKPNFLEKATKAQEAGDWQTANMYFGRVMNDVDFINSPMADRASITFTYAHVLGITCFFNESERYFIEAYELDKLSNGPTHTDLVELARLQFDQKHWQKALPYYERAILELNRLYTNDVQRPAEYAIFLNEYQHVLSVLSLNNKIVYTPYSQLPPEEIPKEPQHERILYGSECR